MTIDVEVGNIAMQLLAHEVRQPTHRENVAAAIQATPSSKLSRSPASTFSAIGSSARSSVWKECRGRAGDP